jgi:hypothetical protein
MRKVVLGSGISLDGYIARSDGAVDFLLMPKDYSMAPFFATLDTAIMGRKTLDAGLRRSGGSLPSYYMAFSAAGQARRMDVRQPISGCLCRETPQTLR